MKIYELGDPTAWIKPSQLDSQGYPGKIIYRASCQVRPDDGASAERRPASAPVGLSKSHISASLHERPASIELYRGASFLRVKVEKDRQISEPPETRGEITEFSDAARRRMLDFMAKIDCSLIPLFVTMTYPDSFPSYKETFKNHLDLLGQRIRRRWPESFIVWKLEFKERKSGENVGKIAPHYHLFVYGVPTEFPFKRETGEHYSLTPRRNRYHSGITVWELRVLENFVEAWSLEEGQPEILDSLKSWMSRNWFEIVGSKDLKHFKAGTRVEKLRSTKGAFYYASKSYMGKSEDCSGLEIKPGRFWGVIGRSKVKLGKHEIRAIPAAQAFVILRLMRRYRRANTPPERRKFINSDQFAAKLYCNVDRWLATALRALDGEADSRLSIKEQSL